MKELDPHNSELIERLKTELKETTHCDASWHSGVNDGMYRLLQYLIENKLVTGGSVPIPDIRKQIVKILEEGITFSGQAGGYVIHGAVDELVKLMTVPTPSDQDINQAAYNYEPGSTEMRQMERRAFVNGANWILEWLRGST